MGSTVVKICGLTNLDDARVAVDAGADLLGFIFYAKSPRYVAPEVAATIVRTLRADDKMTTVNGALRPLRDGETAALRQRPSSIVHRQSSIVNRQSSIVNRQSPRVVGVFVNASIAEIQAVVDSVGLDLVQLHGNETAEWFAPLGGRAYKALRPADAATAEVQAAYFAPLGCADGPALMIDAYDSGAYGGTGKQTDWHVAAALAPAPRSAAGRRVDPRERDHRHRPGAPVGGRCGQRRRSEAGAERSREGAAICG
ncbi:MAG: phosphoribosylanthranilate isomerase [Caldilineaceae bacterium]